ncbi:hypothetical protein EVAR_65961_1 [Eumeta japonica]|uniref:Uncharacterized protein n=1 Tax=Eumeta variegata TaxID=151549 RepID=A0A4C1Z574_EUMVA|nr:hypothetical protein EVAR_65961_1 [Eumeta japonica]
MCTSNLQEELMSLPFALRGGRTATVARPARAPGPAYAVKDRDEEGSLSLLTVGINFHSSRRNAYWGVSSARSVCAERDDSRGRHGNKSGCERGRGGTGRGARDAAAGGEART